MEWKEEYSVGIEEFDEHHKRLFYILKACREEFRDENSYQSLADELIDLASLHFDAEEKAMKKANYAGYKTHKQEHDEIKIAIEKLHYKCIEHDKHGYNKLAEVVEHWIEEHMMTTDQEYVSALAIKNLR